MKNCSLICRITSHGQRRRQELETIVDAIGCRRPPPAGSLSAHDPRFGQASDDVAAKCANCVAALVDALVLAKEGNGHQRGRLSGCRRPPTEPQALMSSHKA